MIRSLRPFVFALAAGLAVVAVGAVVFASAPPQQPPLPSLPGGSLMVAPTRLVFEGRQRSGELTLINRGAATATYRIAFSQMRMNENGGVAEISEPAPGERFADSMVRYSPRQVTLGPGEAQSVRLQIRRPADLEAGEYRSHLVFRYVPSPPSAAEPPGVAGDERSAQGFAVRLTPLVGVAIPVIVRHGETNAQVRLTEVALTVGEAPVLQAVLRREGDRSVLGDLLVRARGADGELRELGKLGRLGVYTPNELRRVAVPLRPEESHQLASGEVLEIVFLDAEQGASRGTTLASSAFRIP